MAYNYLIREGAQNDSYGEWGVFFALNIVNQVLTTKSGLTLEEQIAEAHKLNENHPNNTGHGIAVMEKHIHAAFYAIAQDAAGKTSVEGAVKGGIDFAQSNLDMQIKRDGAGVPLPVAQQDLDNIHIDGLVPVILSIQPAANVPLFTGAAMSAS